MIPGRRRTVAAALAGAGLGLAALAAPPGAFPQIPGRTARVGYLAAEAAPSGARGALAEGLRELGWVEGRSLLIEQALWGARPERIPRLAAGLARLEVEVIVAVGPDAAAAASGAAAGIPIVVLDAADLAPPAASAGRPLAGPAAGLAWDAGVEDLGGRVIEVLRQTLPGSRTLAVLWNVENLSQRPYVEAMEAVAPRHGVRLLPAAIRRAQDLDGAFRRIEEGGGEALIVYPDAMIYPLWDAIVARAAAERLPVLVVAAAAFPGALMAVGPAPADQPRRAARLVDGILRGARPAAPGIHRPDRYPVVVSLPVARALGLTVPRAVLLRADRVIE